MLGNITLDPKSKTPIFIQIAEIIISKVDNGTLENETSLPSINSFNKTYKVARDTVEKAYGVLRKRGYINAVPGKGYYIIGKRHDKLRILFIFNKISSFKRITYYSFFKTMGDKAIIDLQIHHYNPFLLKDIISQNLRKYNYFVIMPHFELDADPASYLETFKCIPENELLILDKILPDFPAKKAVFQDFRSDIHDALTDAKSLMEKYKSIVLVFPEYRNHPPEIIQSVELYGKEQNHEVSVVYNASNITLSKNSVYIVIADDDLVTLIKMIRKSDYELGKDIGIISFNETDLKELLDITVISTDFEKMGETAAELILNNRNELVKNPFRIIKRGSL